MLFYCSKKGDFFANVPRARAVNNSSFRIDVDVIQNISNVQYECCHALVIGIRTACRGITVSFLERVFVDKSRVLDSFHLSAVVILSLGVVKAL